MYVQWVATSSRAEVRRAPIGPGLRRRHKKLLDNGVSPVTTSKAYRLLRAIMNTAVEDGLIRRNPCRIKGAGSEDSPERPVLTVAQVYALADAIDPRYRSLLLLATFASLRWAELAALTPHDIDLEACTVRVTRQINYPPAAGTSSGRPSHAPAGALSRSPISSRPTSARTLTSSPRLLLSSSPARTASRYGTATSTAASGCPLLLLPAWVGTHLHDLRHTGNQFIAYAGANPRELMERMGHDSARAALIYLHSSAERQRTLANQVGKNARAALRQSQDKPKRSGTRKARNRREAS